jgi:hypothetical protein
MHPVSTIHPASFLAHFLAQRPLMTAAGKELPRQISWQQWDTLKSRNVPLPAIIVSVDNGNDAFKGAMLHASQPFLQTKRIPTAYALPKTIRSGEGMTTWQVNGSQPFSIGEDALQTAQVESLPIGFTEERLPDPRYQHFLFAALVELLREAGYGGSSDEFRGEYALYLSFGIPNEELDLKGPKEAVRQTLRSIFNTRWTIRRTDERGQVSFWTLRLVEITPYPQSFASFATWYYTLDGAPIETNIVRHVTLDIGGGQFHSCEVDLLSQSSGRPRLRMSASLLGEGTIAIARAVRDALRARYPSMHLSDVEAQYALMNGVVTLGGRRTSVSDLLSDIIATRAHSLFTPMLPLLQEGQNFLMFTGGGSVLLAQSLEAFVHTKRDPQDVLFVPQEFAPVLNALGGYVLAQATAQRLLARQNAATQPMVGGER